MGGQTARELSTLNIFVVLKVRRHLPHSYAPKLIAVLALYQKPLKDGYPELLTFYDLKDEGIVPDETPRALIKQAWSVSAQNDNGTELCFLIDQSGRGVLIEVNPVSKLKDHKKFNDCIGAYFNTD